MGRQLTLENHCLLCLKDVTAPANAWHAGNSKTVYERVPGGAGFANIAKICDECLGYVRGGNWPPDVYSKLWSKELAKERELASSGIPAAPEMAA